MNAPALASHVQPVIAIAAIVISKTNPRKTFDKTKLAELIDSIKQQGVLQPILVRPLNGGDLFEVVAGERRFKAAKEAGLAEIPVHVRVLTDAQALELQVIENNQREDLHPLEEAEGYEALLKCAHPDGSKYTVNDIAAKVGKSGGYVYQKLKLCSLCAEARKACYDGRLDFSRALLIARIGHHDTQRQALKDILQGVRNYGRKEAMSYREAHQHILQNFMLKLTAAPFDVKDAELLPKAGDCITCPKRTGNQADLFGDVKNADVCTDPKCFDEKRQAHYFKEVQELEAKGKKVVYGDEAKKAFPGWDSSSAYTRDELSQRYVPMSGHTYVGHRQVAVRELLGEDYEPLLVQHPGTGKLVEVATQQAVQAATQQTGKKGSSAKAATSKATKPKGPDVDEVLTERLAKLIYEKAPKEFGKAWLLALAQRLCEHLSTRDLDAVALAWGWKANAFRPGGYTRRLPAETAKLGDRDLVLLMFHMVFAIGAYTRDPVVKLFGIKEQDVREQIIEERKTAARKAREEAKMKVVTPAKKESPAKKAAPKAKTKAKAKKR